MARKRAHEHADERWLLTYADMITLLMALFMVLFSMAVVNKGKFDELARSLRESFAGPLDRGGTSILNVGTSNPTAQAHSEIDSTPQPIQAASDKLVKERLRAAAGLRAGVVAGEGPRGRAGARPGGGQGSGRREDPRARPRRQGVDADQLEGPRDPPGHRQGAVRPRLLHDPAGRVPAAQLGREGRERHRHQPDPRRGAHGRRPVRERPARQPAAVGRPRRGRAVLPRGPRIRRPAPPRHRVGGLRLRCSRWSRTTRRRAAARATAAWRSWCSASTTSSTPQSEAMGPLGSNPAGAAADLRLGRS